MNVLVNSLAVVYLDMKLIIIGSKLAQAPNDIEEQEVQKKQMQENKTRERKTRRIEFAFRIPSYYRSSCMKLDVSGISFYFCQLVSALCNPAGIHQSHPLPIDWGPMFITPIHNDVPNCGRELMTTTYGAGY
ncbi:unnamed protein product [Fusarium graminearum]|uniref:Uncharacterized protein n=1 Tax=Gibberella zeae TaxID=5518 RepID=A0A4E9EAA5_GIBZA|nr:unnamed protein product [Fusarium graminearum]CAF3552307.1 unnamed protein product [Fusarium graminearum]CAG2007961.1 unnamed protein product [Fusarium graminearum]CAG2008043.1 unnamed protein product [Fusarium graminearum]